MDKKVAEELMQLAVQYQAVKMGADLCSANMRPGLGDQLYELTSLVHISIAGRVAELLGLEDEEEGLKLLEESGKVK